MNISPEERRTLIGLAIQVAWADGKVTREESMYVRNFVRRFQGEGVTDREVEKWLDKGAPDVDPSVLSEPMRQYFVHEAMRIMEIDGDVDDEELALIDRIANAVKG